MTRLLPITLDHALAIGIALIGAGLFAVLTRRGSFATMAGVALIFDGAIVDLAAYRAFGRGVTIDGLVMASLAPVIALSYAIVIAALASLPRRPRS